MRRWRTAETGWGRALLAPLFAASLPVFWGGALLGCAPKNLGPLPGDGSPGDVRPAGPMLDILFVVSHSMANSLQATLAAEFPAFLRELRTRGRPPSLHVGVISSSLGAPVPMNVPFCPPGGEGGKLRRPSAGGCSDRFGYFLDLPGDVEPDYDVGVVFRCMSNLGDGGCPFPQPLMAVMRALGGTGLEGGGDPSIPAENVGFLRRGAHLAVIIVSNHDDCSTPTFSNLFDPDPSQTLELGPFGRYRCNAFGHLCRGGAPPLAAPTEDVTLEDCHSNENGRLIPVSSFLGFLRGLQAGAGGGGGVTLAVIAGPPLDYRVGPIDGVDAFTGNPQKQPAVRLSCQSGPWGFAEPPVRLAEAVRRFTPDGIFRSTCVGDLATVLPEIGVDLARRLSAP